MDKILFSLEGEKEGLKELIAVFDTVELAKAFANGEEAEYTKAVPYGPGEELIWFTDLHGSGDEIIFTEADMTYSGTAWSILPVRLNSEPTPVV